MSNVIHNDQAILEVGPAMIAELKVRALASPRKRARLCMHRSPDDRTHEMLIVFHRDSFMPPHRHPGGKTESYHVVEGTMMVYLFDEGGSVIRSIELGRERPDQSFCYRLSESVWHIPVPVSEWLVYHEVYTGPFEKDRDVEFPSWAPAEGDQAAIGRFLAGAGHVR